MGRAWVAHGLKVLAHESQPMDRSWVAHGPPRIYAAGLFIAHKLAMALP